MKTPLAIFVLTASMLLAGCGGSRLEEKGFSVNTATDSGDDQRMEGIAKDSASMKTKPSNVLLTGNPRYRLATVYKVNYNKKEETTFIGSNNYHGNYTEIGITQGNQWNYNFMPGLEAVYGYNLVNIAHYDTATQARKNFFNAPVLIKTLYYPSFSKDTLSYQPVSRNYFMVSVYDEDTNKDGFINLKDLRRFYHFDISAENQKPLVPVNYSVMKSEYDPGNDFMYVFAQLDENENGKCDEGEAIHIFWIDLKNPERTGRVY